MVTNNVSFTNLNNFKIIVNGASKKNDENHKDTVQKGEWTCYWSHQWDKQTKLDYTLIVFSIVIAGILTFCAIKSYIKKPLQANQTQIHGQRLIDIELAM